MQHRTKQQRLVAIADAYMKKFSKHSFTTKEVSEWAVSVGLWPVPARTAPPAECEAWERKLGEATGAF